MYELSYPTASTTTEKNFPIKYRMLIIIDLPIRICSTKYTKRSVHCYMYSNTNCNFIRKKQKLEKI